MPLSDTKIRKSKPRPTGYKLFDGGGLYLHVTPAGCKSWRLKYRFGGKDRLLVFGQYPELSLRDARDKRQEARKWLSEGVDPAAKRKEAKRLAVFNAANTFSAVALEWHALNKHRWTPDYAKKLRRWLEMHLFPTLQDRPIKDIAPLELLDILRAIEKRKATHLAHSLLELCRAVFRFAIVTSRAASNPASELEGALAPHVAKHYPTIQARELPEFFSKLEAARTSEQNRIAIKLLLHTFVRTGELRIAKWNEFDFAAAEWHIPAENTKMRDRHIVPLATQSLRLLEELRQFTGESPYLFPAQQRQRHPVMSENTINKVLRQMDYGGKLVGHGFRALASTTLNEMGSPPDVIERQLAHCERNKVRAAYNRAEYLPQRREMMQCWGDFLAEQSSASARRKAGIEGHAAVHADAKLFAD